MNKKPRAWTDPLDKQPKVLVHVSQLSHACYILASPIILYFISLKILHLAVAVFSLLGPI
jgi:hypothetical protein